MCSGNGSGNSVMQKTLWFDSLYRQNISTLEIHCQLMLVFGDSVLRPHHLGRGCREFKSGLASIMNLHLSARQIKNMRTQCKIWKTIRTQRFIRYTEMIYENCTQHSTCTNGIQQRVCMLGYQDT